MLGSDERKMLFPGILSISYLIQFSTQAEEKQIRKTWFDQGSHTPSLSYNRENLGGEEKKDLLFPCRDIDPGDCIPREKSETNWRKLRLG